MGATRLLGHRRWRRLGAGIFPVGGVKRQLAREAANRQGDLSARFHLADDYPKRAYDSDIVFGQYRLTDVGAVAGPAAGHRATVNPNRQLTTPIIAESRNVVMISSFEMTIIVTKQSVVGASDYLNFTILEVKSPQLFQTAVVRSLLHSPALNSRNRFARNTCPRVS